EGLRSVKLSDIQQLRFANPVIEAEFRRALEVVSLSHDTQKKAVSLHFAGEGRRRVQVGYVVEAPIWKTSYRLVLDADKKARPYLQGWAMVENPTDEDWGNVRMALVSGRPISFRMDLYQPLFVPRPTVEPELFASLRPPTYNSPVAPRQMMERGEMGAPGGTWGSTVPPTSTARGLQRGGEGRAAGAKKDALAMLETAKVTNRLGDRLDLAKGISEAATASNLGDYFEYAIDHPVSLARQKSAMLPL